MTAPQSQAEAMAREVFKDALRIFGGENISEDAAFVKAISTALSKLIAENELLKNGEYDDSWRRQCDENERLQSQLTATEAKLKERINQEFKFKPDNTTYFCCSCGRWIGPNDNECHSEPCLANDLLEILSTLTAEKKEEAK